MAMSLEDLLTEEGFKSSSSKRMTRASSGPVTSIPTHPLRGPSTRLRKTERAYSDTRRYDMRVESPLTDKLKSRRSVDVLKREKLDRGSRNETRERHIRRGSQDTRDVPRYSIDSSQPFSLDEIVEVKEGKQKVNDRRPDKGKYKDIYLNGVFSPPMSKKEEKYDNMDISGKDVQVDNGYVNHQKDANQPGSSSTRSNRSTQNKDTKVRRPVDIESVPEVALDDIAIKAMISILSGYIKSFLKDQDFRTSMYHNCFAAINFSKLEEEIVAESKVISNLDQAIETVEKAADNRATTKELKKASLQLSVITGLNANDLKDGITSGIPNSILSACGHLYLSVVYQLQKKERIAAKHLLQIFCDSPSAARSVLVPELWETVFHPHLSHLEEWYNQEVESLSDDPQNTRKLKQLKKVYNEILDTGTYQFALYYKDWLTDAVEAPSIPSIHVPSVSVQGIQHEDSPPFSSQSMVSKKLYDSVFGQMNKPVTAEVEDYQYSQRSDDDICSFDESVVEEKRTVTYPLEEDIYRDLDVKGDVVPYHQDVIIAKEEGLESTKMLESLPVAKVNELTLKRLATYVFALQQSEKSVDLDDAKYPDFLPMKTRPYGDGGGCFYLNTPEDYVCPLTGLLFEDPVTIETGQTYEREAIVQWFNKGNTTCPVTGKTLECHFVPFTNSILKRMIDGWKSKHSREILASASQPTGSHGEQKYKAEATVFILEQLLTDFGTEENTANAKQLLALGGLQFLIQRFEYGNLDEKTRVAALLSHCIKVDPSCRNHVARHIEKQCLLELLHCKGVKSRANAVFLLFDLICLNRRKDVQFFLNGLHKEGIVSSMHILLLFLQSCSPEQKPLVAVLLLHMDLMVDQQQKYSIYREEAVDTISSAMDASLSNEKVQEACCKALLILGGRISFSGKVMTEDWILKKAGSDNKITIKDNVLMDTEDEEAVEDWLMKLSESLIGDGKKLFLESLSQGLSCGHREMMKVGLTTVVWLSCSLDSEAKLSAFSVLISKLKETLENSEWVEHKVLAAASLLNFSKIPDCMELLMAIGDEIAAPLRNLSEASLTAKQLYALISHSQSGI
ncbi:putative E3 ubiquitin-protein ligase LIN isoform X1 [Lactuca sativa]|uniref:putative E3 ubiquitin-protein ligase LIN isoform X1 n=1 Tax=Lactuca sativa TaxID=4236 RepID=UPI000CD91559|nr:putative E3 ubiquitin-protein ligase LIN isoform X1 [Lactuca sativa]XP_052624581.1 putative E3 ubiquitin-protein ligase LIN isoform X1 [Lactuca sativa]